MKARGTWAAAPSAHRLRRRSPWYRRAMRAVPWPEGRARSFWLAGIAFLLFLVAVIGALLVDARHELKAGVAAIDGVQGLTSSSALAHDPKGTLARLDTGLGAADAHFTRADSRLGPVAPVLHLFGWLPVYGQQVAAAPDAAHLAHLTAVGAQQLLRAVRPAVDDSSAGTAALLRRLSAARPALQNACGSLDTAMDVRTSLRGYTDPAITAPLRTLDTRLPQLDLLCRALVLLPGMLGYPHPATYLVAYQDPNQLRATGGFLGSMGLLTLHNGKPRQKFTGTWLHDSLAYPPPTPIRQYDGEPGWLLRDANWSPDFPTSAALIRFFANLDLGWHGRGVIALTPNATADLLRAVGGFYSPEYHRRIDANNVARLTDYYTHYTKNYGPEHSLKGDTARKQFIAIVAHHIFGRLEHLGPAGAARIAENLTGAIARGDILAQFNNPTEEQLAERAGVAGRVSSTTGDFLDVIDSNISYNKINPYVHLSETYSAVVAPNRWVQSTLTLRFHNQPAPSRVYINSYGPGAGRTGTPADYGGFIRVLVPAGAQLESQSGWQGSPAAPAYGKTMFSGYLIVRKGKTRTVRLRYLLPPNIFSATKGRSYHLLVQHQPGARPDSLRVSVLTVAGPSRTSTIDHPLTDWSTSLPIPADPYHPLPLPAAPPVTVAPGHWIEPDAYLGRQPGG